MIYSKLITGYNELYRSKLYASNCKKSGLHTMLEKFDVIPNSLESPSSLLSVDRITKFAMSVLIEPP